MVSFSSGIQWNRPEGLKRLKINKNDEFDIGKNRKMFQWLGQLLGTPIKPNVRQHALAEGRAVVVAPELAAGTDGTL